MAYFKTVFTYKAHWIIRPTFLFLENVMLSGATYSAETTVLGDVGMCRIVLYVKGSTKQSSSMKNVYFSSAQNKMHRSLIPPPYDTQL